MVKVVLPETRGWGPYQKLKLGWETGPGSLQGLTEAARAPTGSRGKRREMPGSLSSCPLISP